MARALVTVKFQDEQQETLRASPRQVLGVNDLEGRIVVVRGRANENEYGSKIVVADQVYVRPRKTESKQP